MDRCWEDWDYQIVAAAAERRNQRAEARLWVRSGETAVTLDLHRSRNKVRKKTCYTNDLLNPR